MGRNSKKEEPAANSPSRYAADLAKFQELASKLKSKYSLGNYDLIDLVLKNKVSEHPDMIPVSIFDNTKLSCLESISKYMKENLKYGSGKIAELLNRNISTISSTYIKAKKKMPSEFAVHDSKFYIPIAEISTRNFSVLESIVRFLKEKCRLGNKEIAKLLNRDARTVWTVYSRAKKKEAAL